MKSPYGPAYRIVTPRLILRCWEPAADTPALVALIGRNLEFLRKWLYWAHDEPLPLETKAAELRRWRAEFDLDRMWSYAALDAESGELVGGMVIFQRDYGMAAETGGWFGEEFNGRGYHTQGSAALARAVFEVHGLQKVQTTCADTNAASIAVRRKLGFSHDGMIRHLVEGRHRSEMVWSLLADEWPISPAARYAADARAYDALGNRLF
jgi:RimJ/RimL family protein N-acetyltransferase